MACDGGRGRVWRRNVYGKLSSPVPDYAERPEVKPRLSTGHHSLSFLHITVISPTLISCIVLTCFGSLTCKDNPAGQYSDEN
jgi:hypothetical protein